MYMQNCDGPLKPKLGWLHKLLSVPMGVDVLPEESGHCIDAGNTLTKSCQLYLLYKVRVCKILGFALPPELNFFFVPLISL